MSNKSVVGGVIGAYDPKNPNPPGEYKVGDSAPSNPDSNDRDFYESFENCARWARHHLVDDEWYRCHTGECSMCALENLLDERSNILVGQILTMIDVLNLGEPQGKALKDLIKNAIYDEKDRLDLEIRRILVKYETLEEKA